MFDSYSALASNTELVRRMLTPLAAAQLERVESLVKGGRPAEARKLLTDIDLRFGGLAAPQSVALHAQLE